MKSSKIYQHVGDDPADVSDSPVNRYYVGHYPPHVDTFWCISVPSVNFTLNGSVFRCVKGQRHDGAMFALINMIQDSNSRAIEQTSSKLILEWQGLWRSKRFE